MTNSAHHPRVSTTDNARKTTHSAIHPYPLSHCPLKHFGVQFSNPAIAEQQHKRPADPISLIFMRRRFAFAVSLGGILSPNRFRNDEKDVHPINFWRKRNGRRSALALLVGRMADHRNPIKICEFHALGVCSDSENDIQNGATKSGRRSNSDPLLFRATDDGRRA